MRIEFRATAGVREIDRLLHDGNRLAVFARSLQTQGDNSSGGGDQSLVAQPIRSLQRFPCFNRSLFRMTLPNRRFQRTSEGDGAARDALHPSRTGIGCPNSAAAPMQPESSAATARLLYVRATTPLSSVSARPLSATSRYVRANTTLPLR